MNRSTTLTAHDAVANVERYLSQQYAKREAAQQRPVDGVVVILAWCVVVLLWIGGK